MRKNWALAFLLINVLITAWLASTLPRTTFDYNFDKFFKKNDPKTAYFEKHRNTFGTDNDFILIGIVSRKGVFNEAFLEKVDSLTIKLAEVSFVEQVISPTNSYIPIREPLTGGIFKRPLLTGNMEFDSLHTMTDPSLAAQLFSRDTTALSLVIVHRENLSKNQCDTLSAELKYLLNSFDFDRVHLGGRAIGQVVFIDKITREFSFFIVISISFVTVLLYAIFRSFRGVIIPLFTVLLAVVWSIGILNLSGKGVSILLNMLPPVIFVVGMSDAVHLYSRYLEELGRGMSKAVAIKLTIYDSGLATLLTSITTAIGFASLYFTGIPILMEFGLITAAGVLVAFAIAITVLPAWLVLSKEPIKTLAHFNKKSWGGGLRGLFIPIIRYRKYLFAGCIILTVLFAATSSRIELNNYLLEDLRPGEPLRQDFEFFDRYFAGVRPFELGIKLKDTSGNLLKQEHLTALSRIESYLSENYGAGALQSPVAAAREINRARNAGRAEFYNLPSDEDEINKLLTDLKRAHKAGMLKTHLDSTAHYARISGRVGDWGAITFAAKGDSLSAFLTREGYDTIYETDITGTGTLIDRTNQNLVYSLAKGLGFAFLIISLMMGFMFKSIRMVAIALAPNILPLLAVASVMVVFGIELKMSTSIIFTIAFGIAVDDTIHMLSRYKLELMKGRTRIVALRNAYIHTGKALIITSIILFGGFIAMTFSTFQSTFYIGLFVTLTLVFALIFDLTLLPALVASFAERPALNRGHAPANNTDNSNQTSDTNDIGKVPRHTKPGSNHGEQQ